MRDWAILATPWGFRPEDVHVPVQLFHGEIDDRVPLHHAEYLARVIPESQLTVYPEGDMIIFERAEEFLGALTCDASHIDRKTAGNAAKRSMK